MELLTSTGADLSFVHLGITIEHLRNSISIFGFRIAFYGIIIGCGMLAGMRWLSLMPKAGTGPGSVYGFCTVWIIFSIIGARLYYVIFEWDNYKNDLLQIFNLRAGGLAIYGGVIGAVLTLLIFTKVRKTVLLFHGRQRRIRTDHRTDHWPLGQFFNCEAFGGYTDNLFAMRIKESIVNPSMISAGLLEHEIVENGVKYIQVHPTFLYESCWNLCVLAFMLWYRKRKKFDGEMLWVYFLGYGLGRVWIEGLRTDQLKLPGTGLAVSQLLSAALVGAAVGILHYKHSKLKKQKISKISKEFQSCRNRLLQLFCCYFERKRKKSLSFPSFCTIINIQVVESGAKW